jgi:hypothetical protein
MKKTITLFLAASFSLVVSAKANDTPSTLSRPMADNNLNFINKSHGSDGDGVKHKIIISAGIGLNI